MDNKLLFGVRTAKLKILRSNEPIPEADIEDANPMKVVQANLRYSKAASDKLLVFLREEDIDISLIQEPWYISSPDTTVVNLELMNKQSCLISSVYMAHDRPCPPQEVATLQRLAGASPVLLGCDANSRRTLSGSSETNERGSTPTFIFASTPDFCGWEEVLDLALLTEGSLKVNKWRVSDEETLSDHRRILFELNIAADTPTPFRNPRKTDWDLFQKVIGKELKKLPVEDIPTRGELDAKVDSLNKTLGTDAPDHIPTFSEDLLEELLDREKIKFAIVSFSPYKLPAGKRGHDNAKDFRPISLMSFVLKTFERLLDLYVRDKTSNLSCSQHAYLKGKSTETALHEVVRTIESSLYYKQFTMESFIDIEGAFNNVSADSIHEALMETGIDHCVRAWIVSLLRSRLIHA
ncbi:uncharacterized protein LOC118740028 [Rhagoletis pomonella]|uniref:uncharacterized protein LOC118740028 n=1 Tax=Rhagoletis pomonella TaxID=28610 RepID=UPI0017824D48|nr:uncharacterized protein LOC118740028 [Rhagoletis pomonella]